MLEDQPPLPPAEYAIAVVVLLHPQWAIIKSPACNPAGAVITIVVLTAPGLTPVDLNDMASSWLELLLLLFELLLELEELLEFKELLLELEELSSAL